MSRAIVLTEMLSSARKSIVAEEVTVALPSVSVMLQLLSMCVVRPRTGSLTRGKATWRAARGPARACQQNRSVCTRHQLQGRGAGGAARIS